MNETAAQREAASLAWQHAHPLYLLAISTVFSLIIVGAIVLLRWAFSKSAWQYHPQGAGGFLKDEFLRIFAIFGPFLVVGLIFKFYVYELHPELNTPSTWGAFGLTALALRVVLRRLPIIKAVGKHLDAARLKAREARQGAPAQA
ncbi:MAG: hypothetical protein ABUL73_05225 [Alphaproteobacteria bacterium]